MRYLWPAMLTTLCELIRLSDVWSTDGVAAVAGKEEDLPPFVRAAANLDDPRCADCCFLCCGCCCC